MPDLVAISITKRTYAERGIKSGRKIKTMMSEAFNEVLPSFVQHIKRTYLSGPTSTTSISAKKGKLRSATDFYPYETPSGVGVRLEVGGNVPYSPIHVGSAGEIVTMHTAKHFVIPFPGVRNRDGSWRAPYTPGNLRNVKGLFRKGDVLFQRMAGGDISPKFVLKKTIKVPQRVDMRSIERELRPALLRSLNLSFDGYDYGYLRMMQGE